MLASSKSKLPRISSTGAVRPQHTWAELHETCKEGFAKLIGKADSTLSVVADMCAYIEALSNPAAAEMDPSAVRTLAGLPPFEGICCVAIRHLERAFGSLEGAWNVGCWRWCATVNPVARRYQHRFYPPQGAGKAFILPSAVGGFLEKSALPGAFAKSGPEADPAAATAPATATPSPSAAKKATSKSPEAPAPHSTDSPSSVAGLPVVGDGLPKKPSHFVEKAKTGRSTCKKCDKKIDKSVLRVGTQPLFRGKPGYVVWYHLDCATFNPAEFPRGEEVGGYHTLTPEEKEKVDKRVASSAAEYVDDSQEASLAPLEFSGPLRLKPGCLTATLLPYQKDGHSWMVQQGE